MSIIFSGDFHLHQFHSYSTITETGLNSRLAEQIEAIMGIIKWGGDHGATHFIIPGDVFHSQGEYLAKDVIRAAHLLLEKSKDAGMENIIVPGNHDIMKGRTILRPFKSIAEIITKSQSRRIGDDVFTFIPYQRSMKKFKEHLEKEATKIDWESDRTKILVCHQSFSGAKIGPTEYQFKMKSPLDPNIVKRYNYVVAGHCHKAQIVNHNIHYTGSPLQHDHGDEGDERGFLVLSSSDLSFIPVASPRFHTYRIFSKKENKAFLEDYIDGDYYRIVVGANFKPTLPRTRKIRIVREQRARPTVRIQTKAKNTEEVIAEAIANYETPLDKEVLLETVLGIWKESGE